MPEVSEDMVEMTPEEQELKTRLTLFCEEDMSVVKMAAETELSRGMVYYYLNKWGLERRSTTEKRAVSERAEELATDKTLEEEALEELGALCRLTRHQLRSFLARKGYTFGGPQQPFRARVKKQKLFYLYVSQDMSMMEIAEKYGYRSSAPVKAALEYYNIPLKPQGGARGEIRERWRVKAMLSK